jgi:hypothetical protein
VQHVADVIQDRDDGQCFPEARRQLRQKALEGRIDVWGQKEIPPRHYKDQSHSAVWSRIDPTYWHEYEISPLATGELFEDRDHTWNEAHISWKGSRYWSLRVRQQEIEMIWRKPRPSLETTNAGKP